MDQSRRELLRKLLTGAAASGLSVSPAFQLLYPILPEAIAVDPAADSPPWKPSVLTHGQNESLITLSESIVPGSAAAQVNRFIDLLLTVESASRRADFLSSLNAMHSASIALFAKAFPALDDAQKLALLTKASTPAQAAQRASAAAQTTPAPSALPEHFTTLKEWISDAYYSSKPGMKELGWSEAPLFSHYPLCDHPEPHDTRNNP
jgi:hypothetical protein